MNDQDSDMNGLIALGYRRGGSCCRSTLEKPVMLRAARQQAKLSSCAVSRGRQSARLSSRSRDSRRSALDARGAATAPPMSAPKTKRSSKTPKAKRAKSAGVFIGRFSRVLGCGVRFPERHHRWLTTGIAVRLRIAEERPGSGADLHPLGRRTR